MAKSIIMLQDNHEAKHAPVLKVTRRTALILRSGEPRIPALVCSQDFQLKPRHNGRETQTVYKSDAWLYGMPRLFYGSSGVMAFRFKKTPFAVVLNAPRK